MVINYKSETGCRVKLHGETITISGMVYVHSEDMILRVTNVENEVWIFHPNTWICVMPNYQNVKLT